MTEKVYKCNIRNWGLRESMGPPTTTTVFSRRYASGESFNNYMKPISPALYEEMHDAVWPGIEVLHEVMSIAMPLPGDRVFDELDDEWIRSSSPERAQMSPMSNLMLYGLATLIDRVDLSGGHWVNTSNVINIEASKPRVTRLIRNSEALLSCAGLTDPIYNAGDLDKVSAYEQPLLLATSLESSTTRIIAPDTLLTRSFENMQKVLMVIHNAMKPVMGCKSVESTEIAMQRMFLFGLLHRTIIDTEKVSKSFHYPACTSTGLAAILEWIKWCKKNHSYEDDNEKIGYTLQRSHYRTIQEMHECLAIF